MVTHNETTDIALFVRTSQQDIVNWDRRRIVDALVRETTVDIETAGEISKEVERQIVASGISLLTAPLIRELVNAKLIERGLETATTMHARLGFPLFDVGQLLLYRNKENAHVPHSPEGTNLTLAEGIKKEYAVLNVFSPDVGYAHMTGDLHIHDLGYIDRPFCSFQTLEYIKKFGLRLPNTLASAAPARHAETLVAHMVRFAAALQGNFSGAIIWDAVNLFFAPYCDGMRDGDIKQCAQMLIYEFAQQAVARGGQTIYTDMHFYWEVPTHYENVPAIGPGGTFTGKTYGEYADQSRRFVRAVFDVFGKGDSTGKPFVFPQPIVHVTDRFFQTPGHEEFLLQSCAVAGDKGNIDFVFDRGSMASLAEWGGIDPAAHEYAKTPWKLRYAAIQSVSINLPRLGYRSEGDESSLYSSIAEIMEFSARAHVEKREYIERLLSYGDDGPLSLLTMDDDGMPYLKMNDATYLLGMVGLNELVRIHTGAHLHESADAREFGLQVIRFMREKADELSARRGMRFMLVQSLAESTAYRFARLDLKHFSPRAGHFVRGDISEGEVYYTNSTLLDVSSSMEPLEKAVYEGMFHPFIDGGALTHIWLGAADPSPESLARFIVQVFETTENRRLTFSPDFTACMSCRRTARGLFHSCPLCHSDEVEGISKITGYFSKLPNWNKGKRGELRDRAHSGRFFT